ncbi:unnamed protein product [Ophioblennius macclurei]
MEVKLQLGVLLLHVQVSLAVWSRVTVMKGETLNLNCPISNAHRSHVDWKNPEGFLMFFNDNKVLKDKRYSITHLSESQFSISISNISFKDGGNYTCSHYGHNINERKVEVTVIGYPRMSVTRFGRTISIKCSAQATSSSPRLSWKLDHSSEFSFAPTHFQKIQKKYVSESIISLRQLVQSRMTVWCLVRHPALDSQSLMNFVKIGHGFQPSDLAASSRSPTAPPQSSTVGGVTRLHWQSTTLQSDLSSNHRQIPTASSNFPRGLERLSTTAPPSGLAAFSNSPAGPPQSTTRGEIVGGQSSMFHSDISSTHPQTPTASSDFPPGPERLSTKDLPSVSETTEDITPNNSTKGNHTGSSDSNMQREVKQNSMLLVFLVTCLIVGLLVVVLFLVIKLRKAHIAWRKENEDSEASEESNKSKSSEEEKNLYVQRRRGLNTIFTQYVIQEPTEILPEIDTPVQTATDIGNQQHTSHPETVAQTSTRSHMKETSL